MIFKSSCYKFTITDMPLNIYQSPSNVSNRLYMIAVIFLHWVVELAGFLAQLVEVLGLNPRLHHIHFLGKHYESVVLPMKIWHQHGNWG